MSPRENDVTMCVRHNDVTACLRQSDVSVRQSQKKQNFLKRSIEISAFCHLLSCVHAIRLTWPLVDSEEKRIEGRSNTYPQKRGRQGPLHFVEKLARAAAFGVRRLLRPVWFKLPVKTRVSIQRWRA